MKRFRSAMFVSAVCLVTATIWLGIVDAQDAPPRAVIANDSGLQWDNPALDTNGNPTTVDRARIVLSDAGGNVVRFLEHELAPDVSSPVYRLAELFTDIPVGPYALQVRCRGTNGLWGSYSERFLCQVEADVPPTPDPAPPAAPGGLRIVITTADGTVVTLTVEDPPDGN